MNVLRNIVLFCSLCLTACTYHHKLSRGIFEGTAAEPRIAHSVLVASDHLLQKQFIFKDYHSQNSVHSYQIDLSDGALSASADALATLFTTVEVNPSPYAPNYDYYAQLNYTVTGTKTDHTDSVQWFGGQPPVLETRVEILLYQAKSNQPVFSMFAVRQSRIELSNSSAVAQRTENKGSTVLLPLTGPVYTQQFGDDLRKTLARDLSQCLTEIAETLQQNRTLFESHP